MKYIIGIGNPGEKYKNNRHNVGYIIADELKTLNSKLKNIIVKKTNVLMNESGGVVKHLLFQHPNIPISDFYVVFDDLDIPLGSYKIQFAKGPKDHNGLNSIYNELDTNEFWHVRVGIENRDPKNRKSGEEYVLTDFSEEERKILDKTIKKLLDELISK